MSRSWMMLLPLALAACGGPRKLVVRASLPGLDSTETPLAGLGFVALPYNRDSIMDALRAQARTPRPSTSALDSLFAKFRGPFTAYVRASEHLRQLQDSLTKAGVTDSMAPALVAARRARDSAQRELAPVRAELATRGDSLRVAIADWQDSTFQSYDSLTRRVVDSLGLRAVADTTGPDGTEPITLPPRGTWWIYARSWDPLDPNAEWYWNVPVEGDTVVLSSHTGQRKPRY
ncbi:MAG TPA: hypothetical protein VFL95_12810 [Gemmatimonadales bacterium]|nr:hypothetical protein [Gemmatimonadales bacterium]